MKLSAWIILATAALFCGKVPAAAQSDHAVEYRIKQGDTLHDLSRSFFVNEGAIADVIWINRIRNARRLPAGGVLSLPRRLLRYEPQTFRILAFSGPVTISHSGSTLEPRLGVQVAEGAIVECWLRQRWYSPPSSAALSNASTFGCSIWRHGVRRHPRIRTIPAGRPIRLRCCPCFLGEADSAADEQLAPDQQSDQADDKKGGCFKHDGRWLRPDDWKALRPRTERTPRG